MKRAICSSIAISVIFVLGCSRGKTTISKAPRGRPQGAQAPTATPEFALAKMETPEERATYLDQLGKDSSFDPQKHVDILQKYASHPNEDVAAKAKELLARSK